MLTGGYNHWSTNCCTEELSEVPRQQPAIKWTCIDWMTKFVAHYLTYIFSLTLTKSYSHIFPCKFLLSPFVGVGCYKCMDTRCHLKVTGFRDAWQLTYISKGTSKTAEVQLITVLLPQFDDTITFYEQAGATSNKNLYINQDFWTILLFDPSRSGKFTIQLTDNTLITRSLTDILFPPEASCSELSCSLNLQTHSY